MIGTAGSRRCPRCGGNFFLEKDYDNWQMNCIQCGYTRELVIMSEPGQRRS